MDLAKLEKQTLGIRTGMVRHPSDVFDFYKNLGSNYLKNKKNPPGKRIAKLVRHPSASSTGIIIQKGSRPSEWNVKLLRYPHHTKQDQRRVSKEKMKNLSKFLQTKIFKT